LEKIYGKDSMPKSGVKGCRGYGYGYMVEEKQGEIE